MMGIFKRKKELRLKTLYDKYCKLIYWEAYFLLQDQFFAEDAVSETFERAAKNLHKIDEENENATRNFLVIICRNVSKNILRERARNASVKPLEETEMCSESPSPENIVVSKETVESITKAISELDPKYKDVLIMKRVYGVTREEISCELGISVETVKKRLQRAKNIIKEKLREEARDERL